VAGGALLFALDGTGALGARVASRLGVELAAHEEREFEHGEHKSRALVAVRGREVAVLHSLHARPGSSVNDALCRLLFFVGSLRDAGAAQVTAIAPYLCYSRKDRRTKDQDPVTARYVAQALEAVGASQVVTYDVHDLAAFENAFRVPAYNLSAAGVFADAVAPTLRGDVVVLSPDVGGVRRAEAFRDALARRLGREIGSAFAYKHRSGGIVGGDALVGDVRGRTVVILDDLIASGTTIGRAARQCRERGAARVVAMATHGVFTPEASDALADPALDEIVVTDSVEPLALREDVLRRVRVVSIAAGLSEWISRGSASASRGSPP
jgi:ribose-phosphate pyrophosphokinase